MVRHFARMGLLFVLSGVISHAFPAKADGEELRCPADAVKVNLFNQFREQPAEAEGELQYCLTGRGEFRARVTLRKLHPQAQYLLTLNGTPGSPGNDRMMKRCERTPDGQGYCDFRTVTTDARGEVDAVVSAALDPGDYQAKLFVKNQSREPRYRVVLINNSLRFTVVTATGPAVEILLPQTDAQIEHTALVKGRVSDPRHSVYVLVHPLNEKKWWVQRLPSPPNRDGAWQVVGYFGTAAGKGVGEYFEVVAIAAVDKGLLQEGQQLEPDRVLQLLDKHPRSDIVTVKRVR